MEGIQENQTTDILSKLDEIALYMRHIHYMTVFGDKMNKREYYDKFREEAKQTIQKDQK